MKNKEQIRAIMPDVKGEFNLHVVFVCGNDKLFKCISCVRTDRVNNISENAVCVHSIRHSNKEPCFALNDLDLVDCKTVVDGNGNDSLELSLVEGSSYVDLSDFS